MATLPNSKKSATAQLQEAFTNLVSKQMETMSPEQIDAARRDVKEIATKARAARASRHEKGK